MPTTFSDKLSAIGWLSEVRKMIDLGTWESLNKAREHQTPTVGAMVSHWRQQCATAAAAGEMRETSLETYTGIANGRMALFLG